MNFERHTDPLDNIDIGILKTLPLLEKQYQKLVDHLRRYQNQEWAASYINELWKSRPQRFVAECGWANMYNIFNKIDRKEFGIIFNIVEQQCKVLKI